MRILKWVTGGLITLLIVSLFVFYGLVSTQSGLRFLIKFVPENIKAERVDGTLSALSIHQLNVDFGSGVLSIDQVNIEWQPTRLLRRSVWFDLLELDNVSISLNHVENSPTEYYQPWLGIDLPFDAVINNARLTRFELIQKQALSSVQSELLLDEITLKASILSNVLTLQELELNQNSIKVNLSGQADLKNLDTGVLKLTNTIDLAVGEKHLITQGELNGSWRKAQLKQTFQSPIKAKLYLTLSDVMTNTIEWDAILKSNEVTQQTIYDQVIVVDSSELRSGGVFSPAQGLSGLNARLYGNTGLEHSALNAWLLDLDIRYDGQDLIVDNFLIEQKIHNKQLLNSDLNTSSLLSEAQENETGKIQLEGKVINLLEFINKNDTNANADIHGQWSGLSWPVDSQLPQFATNGTFNVVGLSNDFVVSSKANIVFDDLQAVETKPTNTQTINSDISVRIVNDKIVINEMSLRSAQTMFDASGTIDDRFNVKWNLESPDLNHIIPGAQGSLTSQGDITGLRNSPKLALTLDAQAVKWQNLFLKNLNLRSDIIVPSLNSTVKQNTKEDLNLSLELDGLTVDSKMIIESLSARLKGGMKSHNLELYAQLIEETLLDFTLNGGFEEIKKVGNNSSQQWQGQISQFDIGNSVLDKWALSESPKLLFIQDEFSLSSSCLQNLTQSICFSAKQERQNQSAELSLQGIMLEQFNQFFNLYDVNIDGLLNGEFSYLKEPNKTAVVEGHLDSNDSSLSWQESDGETLETKSMAVSSFNVNVNQSQNALVNVNILLADGSNVKSVVSSTLPIGSKGFETSGLKGSMQLILKDLSSLPPILTSDVPLNGLLNVNLDLAGSVTEPQVSMNAKLDDASVEINEVGLLLRDIQLTAHTNEESNVIVNGSLKSGQGELKIIGAININDIAKPVIELVLQSDEMQLVNTNEFDVLGRVDLNLKFSEQLIEVIGAVEVANAEIDFKIPESAVTASSDVILLGEDSQQTLKQRIDLSIDFGQKTHILAQGLDANLRGRLRALKDLNGIMRGEGQIDIHDGKYEAYGQNLLIDKGRIIFNGGSIDNPYIELQAQKEINSDTVGVRVTGSASALNLDLYSDPSMLDQDILSVLIFNKKISSLGSEDGLVLLQIANSLRGDGKSTLSKVRQGIKSTLGLSELDLNLNGDAPNIQAGKQLSKKFYLGYGYGLLDAAQSLILRYQLNKFWSIKADVGADSGADLRYQIER